MSYHNINSEVSEVNYYRSIQDMSEVNYYRSIQCEIENNESTNFEIMNSVPAESTSSLALNNIDSKDNELENIFNTIEKIRMIAGEDDKLKLPQICVIGLQSSGKSSLLGAISGIEFPTDTKTCTKCPIVINLRKGPKTTIKINDQPIECSENINESLKKKILELNNKKSDIDEEPIQFEIVGPNVTPLTLVDMPGIIHNDKALEQKTKKIVKGYTESKNTTILVVCDASQDKAGQVVSRLAKECDPTKERTIEIMTKADCINNNQHRSELIEELNQAKYDPRGVHIVSCKDADGSIRTPDEEMTIFKQAEWNSLDQSQMNVGIENLRVKRLPKQLIENIKINLPDLKNQINKKINDARKVLDEIGYEELDSHSILSYICNGLQATQKNIRQKITPEFRKFIEKVYDIEQVVEREDTDKFFEDDCWEPMIFQGRSAFKQSIKDITAGYRVLVKNLVVEIRDIATKSINENEILVNSKYDDLKYEIMQVWDDIVVKIMKKLNKAFETELFDSSIYNTINHYQTANYFKGLTIPTELEEMFIAKIKDNDFCQKNVSSPCCGNSHEHPSNIRDLMQKHLSEAATEYYGNYGAKNMKEQQQINVFKFVKAYLKTRRKVFNDNMMSIISRVVFKIRKEWLNTHFMANLNFKKYAVDTKDTVHRREKAKETIQKMEDCMRTLKANLGG